MTSFHDIDDEGLRRIAQDAPLIRRFLQELARISRTAERDAFKGSTKGFTSTDSLALPSFEEDPSSEILVGSESVANDPASYSIPQQDVMPQVPTMDPLPRFTEDVEPPRFDQEVQSIEFANIARRNDGPNIMEPPSAFGETTQRLPDFQALPPLEQIAAANPGAEPIVMPLPSDSAPGTGGYEYTTIAHNPLPPFQGQDQPQQPIERAAEVFRNAVLPQIEDDQFVLPAFQPREIQASEPYALPPGDRSNPYPFETVQQAMEDSSSVTRQTMEAFHSMIETFSDYQNMVLEMVERMREQVFQFHAAAQSAFRSPGE